MGQAGRQVSRQAYLGLGKIEERDRDTKRHRDRSDNKNPEQSRVAQLVQDKNYEGVL